MSLRRSARVTAKSLSVNEIHDGGVAESAAPVKKRGRNDKASEDIAVEAIARDPGSVDVSKDTITMPPPPATPNNKRRKIAKSDAAPPPTTPLPLTAGLATGTVNPKSNYSSGDIDDPSPPVTSHRATANHTNATLVTPGGSQFPPTFSNFEESPSKPSNNGASNSSLLQKAYAHLLKVDPSLKPLIDKFDCHPFSAEGLAEQIDPFRSLSSGIMAQQVSGAAAKSIKNKFIALFPPEACPTGFPPPSLVVKTSIPRLREAGLSQRKAEYIQGLAEKFESGDLSVRTLMEGSDDEVKTSLVAVRGLGAWSAEMFMCFGLKRTDVFSTGDLGVQRGMAAWKGRDVAKLKAKGGGKWKYMSEKDMLELSAPFAPYRSLFMWYMWRIEDVDVSAVQDN